MQTSENKILQKETFLLKLSASTDCGFPLWAVRHRIGFHKDTHSRQKQFFCSVDYYLVGTTKLIVYFSDQAFDRLFKN